MCRNINYNKFKVWNNFESTWMELKNFNLNGILRNNDELLDQDILDKSSSSSPKDAHTMLFQYGNINNDCQ
jgi:hypothetical protein